MYVFVMVDNFIYATGDNKIVTSQGRNRVMFSREDVHARIHGGSDYSDEYTDKNGNKLSEECN